jgi:hypothetical protein
VPLDEFGGGEAKSLVPQGQATLSSSLPALPPGKAAVAVPQDPSGSSPLDVVCSEIMSWQRDRVLAITMQSRCDRGVEARIRFYLGYHPKMSDAERKRLSALARSIKITIEKDKPAPAGYEGVAQRFNLIVKCNLIARSQWDKLRLDTEKKMKALSRTLPVWAWIEGVRGVSALGLAVIVGEAGDLSDYPDDNPDLETGVARKPFRHLRPEHYGPACLCKRLGMAVLDGRRQGNPGKDATSEDWITHGYNRKRRAQIWSMLDDVMFRQQWAADKDEDGKNPVKTKKPVAVPAHPLGPYGAHYARKKAEYLAREWTPGHADKAARRYMSKMFLRDLWRQWRAAERALPQGQDALSAATPPQICRIG